MKCTAMRPCGIPCIRPAAAGLTTCQFHDPSRRSDGKSDVASAGGSLARANDRAHRRRVTSGLSIRTVADIHETIERGMAMATRPGASDTDRKTAEILISAARVAAGTLKRASDEKEVDELRALVESLGDRGLHLAGSGR